MNIVIFKNEYLNNSDSNLLKKNRIMTRQGCDSENRWVPNKKTLPCHRI